MGAVSKDRFGVDELPTASTDERGDLDTAQQSRFAAVWPVIEAVDGWLAKEEAAALHAAASSVPQGQWIVEIGASSGRSTAAMTTGKRPGVPILTIDPYASPSATHDTMRAFCENMDRVGAGHEVQLFWGTSEEAARSRSLVFAAAAARARVLDARDAAAAPGDVRILADVLEGPAPCGPRVFRVDGPKTSSWIGEADIDSHEPEIGLLFIDGLHDQASVLLDIDLWEPLVAEGGTVVFHDAFFRGGVTRALFKRHLLNSEFRYERSLVMTSIFRRVGRLETVDVLLSGLRLATRTPRYAHNQATSYGVRYNVRWLQRLFPPLPDFEYY